jgi:hypothetical protein
MAEEALSERYEKGRLLFDDDQGVHEMKHPRKTSLLMMAVVDRLWLGQYGFTLSEAESAIETDDDGDGARALPYAGWYISCHGEIVSDDPNGRKSEWHRTRGEDGLNCAGCKRSRVKRGSRLRYPKKKS